MSVLGAVPCAEQLQQNLSILCAVNLGVGGGVYLFRIKNENVRKKQKLRKYEKNG